MNRFERFALDMVLQRYPRDVDFDEVIERIETEGFGENGEFTIWLRPEFENIDPEMAIEYIHEILGGAMRLARSRLSDTEEIKVGGTD